MVQDSHDNKVRVGVEYGYLPPLCPSCNSYGPLFSSILDALLQGRRAYSATGNVSALPRHLMHLCQLSFLLLHRLLLQTLCRPVTLLSFLPLLSTLLRKARHPTPCLSSSPQSNSILRQPSSPTALAQPTPFGPSPNLGSSPGPLSFPRSVMGAAGLELAVLTLPLPPSQELPSTSPSSIPSSAPPLILLSSNHCSWFSVRHLLCNRSSLCS